MSDSDRFAIVAIQSKVKASYTIFLILRSDVYLLTTRHKGEGAKPPLFYGQIRP